MGGRQSRRTGRGLAQGFVLILTPPSPPLPHSRPKTSFNWFVNPLKTFVFFIWRRYWRVLLLLLVLALITVFLLLVFYTMPGQISQLIFHPLHDPPPGSN